MATLSYAADLGLGQPMEHCVRQAVIALRLADLVGADERDRRATCCLGLVMNAHCHADAAEQASCAPRPAGRPAGRLDGEAVNAVLNAAGQRARARQWPAGLTAREGEVLGLRPADSVPRKSLSAWW